MPFSKADRLEMLHEAAPSYVEMALRNITRQYPVMPYLVESGPGPYPSHREAHPAFFGCLDWHSCVELQWVIVRLLRLFPDSTPGLHARAILNELLTEENIAIERAFLDQPYHGGFERPYGWGWFLTFHHELSTWDDPDARRWHAALQPLADYFSDGLVKWLPVLTYPHRSGLHSNTAFSLSLSLNYAAHDATNGKTALLDAITEAAIRFFHTDTNYPANYEPSGSDFLSAALTEAELMSRLMPADRFAEWLTAFLPGLGERQPASIFTPAFVSDSTDGHIAHLHGLNVSRAAAYVALSERLPAGDSRIAPMMESAEQHARESLSQVVGSDYMVEHWLAVYAMLLLS